MKKIAIIVCFFYPIIAAIINLQFLAVAFISTNAGRLVSRSNLLLVLLGIFIIQKDIKCLSKTSGLWLKYYLLYYSFGLLATGIFGFESPIVVSLIPVAFFISFYFFLSIDTYRITFFKVITYTFLISSILTVILFKMNYDFDYGDIGGYVPYQVNRASGLYQDANSAALVNVIAYILFDKYFNPINKSQKIIKILLLIIISYSVLITYSTTGLFALVIIFIITNYKLFKGLKLIIFGILFIIFYLSLFLFKSYTSELNLTQHQIYKLNNFINLLTLNTNEIDNSGRGALVERLFQYIYQNPILGNGIEFSVAMSGHNTYVGVWGDAGLITFLFFIFLLIIYLTRSMRLKIEWRFFCLAMLITLCVFMMSLQSVINQEYLMVVFVFLGYIIDNQGLVKKDLIEYPNNSMI